MKYEVIIPFRDLKDVGNNNPNGRLFAVGDIYPFGKQKASAERIEELASSKNKLRKPVIKEGKGDS